MSIDEIAEVISVGLDPNGKWLTEEQVHDAIVKTWARSRDETAAELIAELFGVEE